MLADSLTTDPLVIFVGAGASALPPSSLPGWTDFNSVLLECLGEQVSLYSRDRQPMEHLLAAIKERRDTTSFLPPDFQAQLMEEEIGADYFRVWQSLDTDVYGPVHAGIAELAAMGRVAAIVTTNFDRLLEIALHARGVPCAVHHDQAAFDALGADLIAGVLPILKIHGSIEDADSLVDTLRQRLTGRPASLQAALRALLVRHHWVFLGFSGADFSYDERYLGILDAADEARGFTFLARAGQPVEHGVTTLVERFGAKASLVTGDLRTWLPDTFSLPVLAVPDAEARSPEQARAAVRARVAGWAAGLGPIAVVNILCAMLRSMQMEDDAHWLLRRTWRRYRSPADTRAGASYDRYTFNYGLSLMTLGCIGNSVVLADDMSNILEHVNGADDDAREFFWRAYGRESLHVAGAQHATCIAYLGHVAKALDMAAAVEGRVTASGDALAYIDVALACVPLRDMMHAFGPTLPQLARCVATARALGDEPRRALALVHFARFCCMAGIFDTSRDALEEAERIAKRLALAPVQLLCRSVRGRLLLEREKSDDEALAVLQGVVDELHARAAIPLFTHVDLADPTAAPTAVMGTPPQLCRALLDLNRAASFARNADVMRATLRELDDLTERRFLGYAVHTAVAQAECLLYHGDATSHDAIADCIEDVRTWHQERGNPWAGLMAGVLSDQLAQVRAQTADTR